MLLALQAKGFRISAAGTGDSAPFARASLDYHRFHFARFVDPVSDRDHKDAGLYRRHS